MEITIRNLNNICGDDLLSLSSEQFVQEYYHTTRVENNKSSISSILPNFSLQLDLLQLETPMKIGGYIHTNEDITTYNSCLSQSLSFGAYNSEDRLIGFIIAEKRDWNNTIWVWEFCVHKDWRRNKIGSMLMDKLKEKSKSDLSLALIVCETQTKNTPAIKFYINQGFQLDGIDVSYYGDDGLKNQNVALFFKFRLNQ